MAPNVHGHLFINIHLLLNILGLHGQVFESATKFQEILIVITGVK
jgi:hypothetical protein